MTNATSKFAGQFIVSTERRPHPQDWLTHEAGPLFIHLSPTTKIVPVVDGDRKTVGMLLGTPIDLEKRSIVSEAYAIDATIREDSDIDAFVEDNIYRLTGSFIFILQALRHNRIYLDANGSMSLVFDPKAGTAAATAAVLLDNLAYQERFRKDLYKLLDVEHAGWFTAGLTAQRGIERLLCNHYLDLGEWRAVRHWPTAPIEISSEPLASYDKICSRITQTTEILADQGATSVALTAGYDSRFLLACCRQLVKNVSFVTVDAPAGEVDVACATQMASKFGLHHEILPYHEATSAQSELWQLRSGHCVGGNNVKLHPSVKPLEGRYFVGGLGGEVGRGFLWLNAERNTPLDARDLVARLKLPQHALVIEKVDAWLRPLSQFDTLFKLDLAYIELRMSCWGFCDSYVKPAQNELHPMVSRANYLDMLSVEPEKRRTGKILHEAINARWPEILEVPINRYGNWRDHVMVVKKALRDPRRARKKAVQLARSFRLARA